MLCSHGLFSSWLRQPPKGFQIDRKGDLHDSVLPESFTYSVSHANLF